LDRERQRYELLFAIYAAAEGDSGKFVPFDAVASHGGGSRVEACLALDYLIGEGLVVVRGSGPTVSITHRGIVEVEQSLRMPSAPTDHFASTTIMHFHGHVGAVQTGARSVANVLQDDRDPDSVTALQELRDQVALLPTANRTAVQALVESIASNVAGLDERRALVSTAFDDLLSKLDARAHPLLRVLRARLIG
jgi:hypothetical protein